MLSEWWLSPPPTQAATARCCIISGNGPLYIMSGNVPLYIMSGNDPLLHHKRQRPAVDGGDDDEDDDDEDGERKRSAVDARFYTCGPAMKIRRRTYPASLAIKSGRRRANIETPHRRAHSTSTATTFPIVLDLIYHFQRLCEYSCLLTNLVRDGLARTPDVEAGGNRSQQSVGENRQIL